MYSGTSSSSMNSVNKGERFWKFCNFRFGFLKFRFGFWVFRVTEHPLASIPIPKFLTANSKLLIVDRDTVLHIEARGKTKRGVRCVFLWFFNFMNLVVHLWSFGDWPTNYKTHFWKPSNGILSLSVIFLFLWAWQTIFNLDKGLIHEDKS